MTGTAVAHPAFASREQLQPYLDQRREIADMARAFRNTLWGKDLPEATARSIAHWCKRHGVDATEVSVLGGQPYIEATYYLRRLASLDATLIEYAFADHVHADARLLTLMEEPIPEDADEATREAILANRAAARREHYRRVAERIKHSLPDSAVAAVVYRVKKRGMEREFTGADWCGGKGKKTQRKKDGTTYEREIDPIGDAEPRKTAETRAARRCLRQVIATFPSLNEHLERAEREARVDLVPAIEHDLAEAQQASLPRPVRSVATAEMGTAYDFAPEAPTEEVVEATVETSPGGEAPTEDRATTEQLALHRNLMTSRVWTRAEQEEAARFAAQASKAAMSERLDFIRQELAGRKAARKATAAGGADAA